MKNYNIKSVIFTQEAYNGSEKFVKELKKNKTKIAVLYKNNFKDMYNIIDVCINVNEYNEDAYIKATELLNTPIFHCIVFDNTLYGITCAKNAGLRTVAVGTKELIDFSDQEIKKFSDIEVVTFLECGKVHAMPVCKTAIIEENFVPNDINHIESLFALGNGYIGIRGTYDESDNDINEVCGMYINGIFATAPYHHLANCVGFAVQDEFTVNLSDWRIIDLYIDGEKACFSNKNIINHRRILDMQNGKIDRSFIFQTNSGKKIEVESTRIVNMTEVHGAEIRYSIKSLNFKGKVTIKMRTIKCTPIQNIDTCKVIYESVNDNDYVFTQEVLTTKQVVTTAICHRIMADNYSTCINNTGNEYCITFTSMLSPEDCVVVYKYAAFCSSMDKIDNKVEWAVNLANNNSKLGFESLCNLQQRFWNDYWLVSDISIKGKDDDCQAVRFSLFQLRQQLATVNDCSIGATGLTGPGYSGKVFWDTEMYLMPYYNYTNPELQKGLLMYRYRILDRARERAKEFGLCGAMYSWCSIDGIETSVVFEASTAEYHINSDIAYSVWRYVDSTQDKQFLYNYGAEIVFETAKFMYRRGCFIKTKNKKFCMNAVCGPDEYACGVNNNCYTNLMLQFHLNYAISIANEMKENTPQIYAKLAKKLIIDDEEISNWKKAADNIYYKFNEELQIYEQDDNFIYNDPVDMSKIPMNCDIRWMYHPLDLWRKQVSKQADVVLINFIRGNIFTKEEKLADYNYYEPRCNHGSSLSTAIHAIMACELKKAEAYEFFRCSAYMDISDFKKNTNDGLHLACLGGVWMTIVNGYLGMRHYENGLFFNPHIPSTWDQYSCKIIFKGARVEITVSQKNAEFKLIKGNLFSCNICGKEIQLSHDNLFYSCKTLCL